MDQQQRIIERLNNISLLDDVQQMVPSSSVSDVCHTLLRAMSGDASAGKEAKEISPVSFASAIHSVAVDCLRCGIEPEELAKLIEQHQLTQGGNGELCNAFLDAFRANFEQLQQAMLKSTSVAGGSVYPKIVGMDWSILSVIESTEGSEIEEPLAEICFKTTTVLPTQGAPQNNNAPEGLFKFVCNKNQLQDFHWKVTEVCNFIQKMASKEH